MIDKTLFLADTSRTQIVSMIHGVLVACTAHHLSKTPNQSIRYLRFAPNWGLWPAFTASDQAASRICTHRPKLAATFEVFKHDICLAFCQEIFGQLHVWILNEFISGEPLLLGLNPCNWVCFVTKNFKMLPQAVATECRRDDKRRLHHGQLRFLMDTNSPGPNCTRWSRCQFNRANSPAALAGTKRRQWQR